MEMCCVSCKKNTGNTNPSVRRARQNRFLLVPSCAACSKKKSKFIKNQEASGLLNKLGINPPLNDKKLFYLINIKRYIKTI